jgi:ABC-type branched-subunit amino acid transport system substrate-binding protein
MRKAGMRVNVWVYDVDDLDSGKTAPVLAKPEFSNMDLIIGPFSPGPFDEVAEFANAHHIGIVSPVSTANRVLFKNPMAMKSVPSVSTQMEQLAQHIYKERKEENVILITSGLLKEQKTCNSFRDEMNRQRVIDAKDSLKVNQGFSGIESKLVKDKMNVLVIPSTSQAFVTDLLRNLYGLADKYQITVYGMPAWMDYDNLDFEYLEALHFHFAAPYFVDYETPGVKRFIQRYRNVYGGDPTTFSFAGYDNTMFFLQQLKTTGTGFVPGVPAQKGEGLQQTFSFLRSDAESGYENIGLRIIHMSDYELVPFGFENPKKDKK